MEKVAGAHCRLLADLRGGRGVEAVFGKAVRRGIQDVEAAFLLFDGVGFAHGLLID
ncbi:hypothetical protein D3C71_2006720 [compost metagenome]